MKKFIVGLGLFFLASVANAQAIVRLEFTPPTECENGDLIGGTEDCTPLEQYRLQCSATPGKPYELLTNFYPAVGQNQISDYFVDGEYYCVLSVSNSNGWSFWSGETHFTVSTPEPEPDPSKPKRITNITIAVEVSQ